MSEDKLVSQLKEFESGKASAVERGAAPEDVVEVKKKKTLKKTAAVKKRAQANKDASSLLG